MSAMKKLLLWLFGSKASPPSSRCPQFQLDSATLRIDAAAYCKCYGVNVEPSTEGGQNVASLDKGDWLSWELNVKKADTYLIKYRVSSLDGHGAFELSTPLGTLAVKEHLPHTDGWQEWATVIQEVKLPAGKNSLTMKVTQGGWNIRWLEFSRKVNVNSIAAPSGFVRADSKQIVGPDGVPLLLKGIGLGGFMIQEPYLMMQQRSARSQWQMFEQIAGLIGKDNFNTYRQAWLDNYFTLEDVKQAKKAGFNSIRIPLHYNLFTLPIEEEPIAGVDTWLESGFTRLDQLIAWIASEGMYSIIDLHAAPGGQGLDSNISDYDSSKPSLWESDENIRKTIALWKRLAARYAKEPSIAGYDLLNEPNWGFSDASDVSDTSLVAHGCFEQTNLPLKNFYKDVIAAIREVDNNHLIYVQGNCWGNNHKGIWPIDDDNIALSFHRYWVENTIESIEEYIDLRSLHNIPLWMGESGEHHNNWGHAAVDLLEIYGIGWSWWSWKKMQSNSGVLSIYPPAGYQTLLDYWDNSAPKPNPTYAFNIMMQIAEAAKINNVFPNHATIKALTGVVPSCEDTVPLTVDTRVRLESENACSMLNAAHEKTDDVGGGLNIWWEKSEGWISHKIKIVQPGTYQARYRVASLGGGGPFQIELNQVGGTPAGQPQYPPVTGSWQKFTTIEETLQLPQGEYELVIRALAGGWNLNWIELAPVT
ncbi:hypothetical protein FisN_23Hh194 [Fistulifera solaris]|uniref:CBM6 domain-containing protein n=1 Tax=Fistulifera solaris TaxID=1519565 RepID=A0A1Z5JX19_FISSO|nr:hypothetical protein FisN_23Hh194 [Fistulifera solaris]|eukprot:GAX18301.1 hypothetical protein FisN_23Hh194 [Fistulifera solaris]